MFNLYSQSEYEIKHIIGVTWVTLIENKVNLDKVDTDMLVEIVKERLNNGLAYNNADLFKGLGWSILSGLSLGIFEANAFGYKYPALSNGNDLKRYLTWNTPTEKVFGKILYPQKISRELLYISTRNAINNLQRYFKKQWYYSYPIWWVVHNTIATIWRDWASGKGWDYSLDYSLIF